MIEILSLNKMKAGKEVREWKDGKKRKNSSSKIERNIFANYKGVEGKSLGC